MPETRSCRGFTLYELVMTLAIAGLVLTVGIPSFGGLVADKRLRAETDALFHAFHLARKASIARRRVISLCPSPDGASCAPGTDWSAGWILFVNDDRDDPPRRDSGERLLATHRVDGRVRIAANRRGFTLRATYLRATNGTLIVCDRGGRAQTRAVVVSYTGRPRVTREDARGDAYACPD